METQCVALAWLASGLTGCAHIGSFHAEPRNVCTGDEVRVAWEARWRPRIDSKPVLPETGTKPHKGSQIYVVSEPTRFVLTAKGLLGEKTAQADIDVAPPEHTFGDIAACDGARLRTNFVLSRQVSPAFTVAMVRNVLRRRVIVEKGSRSVPLDADAGSDALKGESVLGAWTLLSPLESGETCDEALDSIRQRLRLQVALECGS